MLLVLHAVRLKGFADTDVLAARFGLDPAAVGEELLDAEAYGWVSRSSFAGLSGWSLSEAGRARNEALLREELDAAGARDLIAGVHEDFRPLNAEAVRLMSARQVGKNADLGHLSEGLAAVEQRLVTGLRRFGGYHDRFASALRKGGEWITGNDVDSCHRVWFELHEDLIATLGVGR